MDHQDVDDDEDGDEEKDVEQLRHQSHHHLQSPLLETETKIHEV